MDHRKWATYLLDAEQAGVAVQPISSVEPELTLDDAYAVQELVVQEKLASGRRIVGAKLGLTSRAKQSQMGIASPVCSLLTDDVLVTPGGPVPFDELIHPRVEPEIVFVLGDDLAGPGVTSHGVLDATAAVCCGLEVIDSRYEAFRFTAADAVADRSSAARVVLGTRHVRPFDLDLPLVGMVLERGAHLVDTAAGAACLGDPAAAVAWLANWLGARGTRLEAGWIVFSGGLTSAVELAPADLVTATFAHLGSVSLRTAA